MMKISVATTGNQADSFIPSKSSTAKYLFIVDVEGFEVTHIYEAEPLNRDLAFAQRTIEENCEAIVCGEIRKEPFELLAGEGISRYNGAGKTATEAVKLFINDQLPMITDDIGGSGCPGSTSGGECHEH